MLQELSVSLFPGIAQFLGSIPSSSVSLIYVENPYNWGYAPTTYSKSWPWGSFERFQRRSSVSKSQLAEFTDLGVSIRKIAQRYSGRHPGSKTRVQASLDLEESEVRAVENGDIPFYKAKLEEELGDYVDFELIIVPYVQR